LAEIGVEGRSHDTGQEPSLLGNRQQRFVETDDPVAPEGIEPRELRDRPDARF
jgi:hypothetical protein